MNRQNYKVLVWLVVILLILNISALGTIIWLRFTPPAAEAVCFKNRKDSHHHFRMHNEYVREKVGFNPQQMESFKAIRDKHFTAINGYAEEIESTRMLQFNEVQKQVVNQPLLDSLHLRIGELHREWAENSSAFLIQAKNICTPDQQESLFKLLEQSKQRQGYRSKARDGRGQGPGNHSRGRALPCEPPKED